MRDAILARADHGAGFLELLHRAEDNPGASDLAVAQFRRMMVAAAKKLRDGGAAIGAEKEMPYASLASFEGIAPKTTDWRTLGVKEETVAAK